MKTASLLPLLALVALPACTNDDVTLLITGFVRLDPQQMCVANPTGGVLIDHGTLDVGILAPFPDGRGYTPAPIIQNNIPDRSSQTIVQRDDIEITGFDVELLPAPGTTLPPVVPNKFFAPSAAGAVPPGEGKLVAFPEVIPRMQALQLATGLAPGQPGPTVIAHMRPVGTRASGTITGGFADFPIKVCVGCLGDPNQPCPTGGFKQANVLKGGCYPAQDDPITCCNTGTTFFCGEAVPQM
jgi:hypothetical protein